MISRSKIAETEIETGVSSKPRRIQERFLKGPIPIRSIASAAKLPGQSLSVYLAVHHQTALTRRSMVTLPKTLLAQLGISRDAKARALKQLHDAGLVRVENCTGRAARIELRNDTGSKQSPVNEDRWSVTNDGLLCSNPYYPIPKSQLAELRDHDNGVAMWPLQMADKSWVDIEAFITVFDQALDAHKPDGINSIDRSATYALARKRAAERVTKRE